MIDRPIRVSFATSLVLGLGLAACASGKTATGGIAERGGRNVSDYYPLAIGNAWTYVQRFGADQSEKTITIVSSDGRFFIDDAGGEFCADTEGLRDRKRYLLKYPLEAGNKWLSVVSQSSVERYEIIDTSAKVTVPAGTFEGCLLVIATNRVDAQTEMVGTFYYARGVGLVKVETFMKAMGKEGLPQTTIELVRYKLNVQK